MEFYEGGTAVGYISNPSRPFSLEGGRRGVLFLCSRPNYVRFHVCVTLRLVPRQIRANFAVLCRRFHVCEKGGGEGGSIITSSLSSSNLLAYPMLVRWHY